jgi:C-5 cytosine-specific DNA methylase
MPAHRGRRLWHFLSSLLIVSSQYQRPVKCSPSLRAAALCSAVMTPSNASPNLSFAEFFARIGLMRLGLEREGWRVVWANDNDPQKLQMYETQFGGARDYYRTEDIRNLKGTDVPSVALATASFPCNDLSLAGARAGLKGRHSSMFWEFTRILAERETFDPARKCPPDGGWRLSNRHYDHRLTVLPQQTPEPL